MKKPCLLIMGFVFFAIFTLNFDIFYSLIWSFLLNSLLYFPFLFILYFTKVITSQISYYKHLFGTLMIFKISGAVLIFLSLISNLIYGTLYSILFVCSISLIDLFFAKEGNLISSAFKSTYLKLLFIMIIDVSFLICGGIFNVLYSRLLRPIILSDLRK